MCRTLEINMINSLFLTIRKSFKKHFNLITSVKSSSKKSTSLSLKNTKRNNFGMQLASHNISLRKRITNPNMKMSVETTNKEKIMIIVPNDKTTKNESRSESTITTKSPNKKEDKMIVIYAETIKIKDLTIKQLL